MSGIARLALIATGFLALTRVLSADEPQTRAESLRREREKRVATLRPYKPAFIEKQILAFEKAERPSLLELNLRGFYPRFQSIARGSSTAGGVRYWQPDLGGSRLSVHGSAFLSLKGYEYYDLQVGLIPHEGRAFPQRAVRGDDVHEVGNLGRPKSRGPFAFASARYESYPQINFFGVGPDASTARQTTFFNQDALYEVVGGVQITPRLAARGSAGYLQYFVGRGENQRFPTTQDLFDDVSAPGLVAQPDFYVGSLILHYDGRDRVSSPHRGGFAALQLSRYDDKDGDAFAFTRLALDLRGFVPLGSVQRTLALRAYGCFDSADDGARVPFYLMQDLGGSHTLRGFQSFRFRDTKLFIGQAEYRWEPSPILELALFAEAGRVAPRAGDLFEDLEADYGFGVRLKPGPATLRCDIARGREGTRVLVRFNQAW